MSGYDQPQHAKDQFVVQLYSQHDLGEAPTMQQIEPVAIKLLSNVATALDGAALVLGREVGATESFITQICFAPAKPSDKFALLMMQRSLIEER